MKLHSAPGLLPALLLAGFVLIPAARPAMAAGDSDQVSKLLSDAKTQAYQVMADAGTLETYTRENGLSSQSYAEKVNQMKEHINATAATLTSLDNSRKDASPWQATAIDRIKPMLREIATDTTLVIDYINKNPKKLTAQPFQDYVEANSDQAQELARLIADFVDYGNTKDRLNRLASKLELGGM